MHTREMRDLIIDILSGQLNGEVSDRAYMGRKFMSMQAARRAILLFATCPKFRETEHGGVNFVEMLQLKESGAHNGPAKLILNFVWNYSCFFVDNVIMHIANRRFKQQEFSDSIQGGFWQMQRW